MEDVLEVYTRPYDPRFPVVCLDEVSKQVLCELRPALPMEPGQVRREDYEYARGGVLNLFLCCEPLRGWRTVSVTEQRTKLDWAEQIQLLVDVHYPQAERIVLVLDNLNTHTPAALYDRFAPAQARRLVDQLELHYTPKHGSWLNMAEIEVSVLSRQCLERRVPDRVTLEQEVAAWVAQRNARGAPIDWRFTTTDARIKLRRLYPSFQE
jgi:transposase